MEIDLTKYLPVAAAILSATLGYLYGVRTKKNDRLIQFTQENLKEIFSPMYHEMKELTNRSLSPKVRESMIEEYFRNYLSSNTLIFKLGSLELLDTFYELEEQFREFKLSRCEKKWKEFWYDFENILFHKVKEGYRSSINVLYGDFNWQQFLQTRPYWQKFYYETMRFLFETVKGINVISLLLIYFSVSFKLFGLKFIYEDFWLFSILIFTMSIFLSCVLIMPNMKYITLTSNSKQSMFRKIFSKLFPKLLNKFDKFLNKKNYDKVPVMPKGNIMED